DAAHLVGALPPPDGAGFRFWIAFLETPTRIRSFSDKNGRAATMRLAMSLLIPGSFAISASVALLTSTPVRVMTAAGVAGCAGAVPAGAASPAAGTAARASGLVLSALGSAAICAPTSVTPFAPAPAAVAGTLAGIEGRKPVICGLPDLAAGFR